MSQPPRVAIILQAYNQGRYVDDAIAALKRQTFQDFEIILIDDGSNDGFTPGKLAGLDYDKITRKHLYKTNLGAAARQRQQYPKIKNDYLMIHCGDDVLAPTFLEKTVAYLDSHPHCGAVSTHVVICFNNHMDLTPPNFVSEVNAANLTLPNVIAHENFLGSALMRRTAIQSVHLDPSFHRYQDWDRWVSLLEAGWELGNVPEPLFFYRQLDSSLAHSASIEDELAVRRAFFKRHSATIHDHLEDYYLAIERRNLSLIKDIDARYLALQADYNRLNQTLADVNAKNQALAEQLSRPFFARLKRKLRALFE